MKRSLLVLSIVVSSLQTLAWDQVQVDQCKNNFRNYVPENMQLRFVCENPMPENNRSSFIAIEFSPPEYSTTEHEVYSQLAYVVVCGLRFEMEVVNQANDLISGVELLRLIGYNADERYLSMISEQNRNVLQSLSEANCTDPEGQNLGF